MTSAHLRPRIMRNQPPPIQALPPHAGRRPISRATASDHQAVGQSADNPIVM